MNLSDLIPALPIQPQPGQRWAVLGPEAEVFRAKFRLAAELTEGAVPSDLDGLLLAGALSARAEATPWLKQMLASMSEGTALVVVEWQGDGPLDLGPDLERRFKRGKLSRLLWEEGWSQIELLVNTPCCYVLRAVKAPLAPPPHAGEFVTVATLDELPKNRMKRVELFGQPLIVANTGREIVAFAQVCPHAGTSLLKGTLKGRHIVCPLHFYMWNVCTGEPVEPADEDILPCYPVRVDAESGLIQVALAP
ncbi:MAG: Rieske (2Fe-2S) protein [Anaerolineales bacterium]|nr:Rieske (2Fe-2S) protein [Anaerolineales bacterium]